MQLLIKIEIKQNYNNMILIMKKMLERKKYIMVLSAKDKD